MLGLLIALVMAFFVGSSEEKEPVQPHYEPQKEDQREQTRQGNDRKDRKWQMHQ